MKRSVLYERSFFLLSYFYLVNDKKITIAIDGFSSCGKSTLAKDLASSLGYIFIDSGAMYRAITLFALNNKLIHNDQIEVDQLEKALPNIELSFQQNKSTNKPEIQLNGTNVEEAIRMPQVNENVSKIATIESVRHKLVEEQRKMGTKGGIVMDGRDIGSVVFPKAELKLFVTANIDIRTNRRFLELTNKGINISKEEVQSNLLERDHIDSTREISPLIQPDDAVVIDNSFLTREEQLQLALSYVSERTSLVSK